MEAAACLVSGFHCQRAPSHRGLEHGFCEASPSKLHLPTKKSNMIYGLFCQKLSLATVNCRGRKPFSSHQLQKVKSMPLLYVSYSSFVAPFGMVPASGLSSLGAILSHPSSLLLPSAVYSAFEGSCRTSPQLCQLFMQHLCPNTLEGKSTFHVATDLGRKSKESGSSLTVSKIKTLDSAANIA